MNFNSKLHSFLALCLWIGLAHCVKNSNAQDLSHRKSELTITVVNAQGVPVPDAVLGLQMKQHAFKFGTQVRDRFFSISETEFNSLNEIQKQNLLPNLTGFGMSRYTPDWQDAVNYRQAVLSNFNHVVPTVGLQWVAFENNGPAVPDSAISIAQENGLSVTGASVVWQRDRWPTPVEFRSGSSFDAQEFHDRLVDDRLSATGIMGRYSESGAGPVITDWKVLNEPIHESYYADTFVEAGIYDNEVDALADYFVRADRVRSDSVLSINEFNILNSGNDNAVIEYRDLINDLLAAGAPIDRIGVQAHMSRNDVSKADIVRRLDILAETGLGIEITEFDSRDDADQLTPEEQERVLRDMLEASFESQAVDGFIMWGIWDPGHWRGNAPLFDEDWNIKDEASPWFDLVRGEWMPMLTDLELNSQGKWTAPDGLISGAYDFTVTYNGKTRLYSDYDLSSDGNFLLAIPEPSAALAGFVLFTFACRRRRVG
ncbi:MAG: endo-1,4-beta-xylanase [Mariniblastus sp.]|nr:endo-1,4-beta-xylanase [Mariniblastus sp.]